MIAHTLGNPFDLSAVKAFCDEHNLWLVEDNCDALGTQYTINGETRFYRHLGRHRHVQFLPAAPHDDGRGRLRLHQQPAAEPPDPLLPRLGP